MIFPRNFRIIYSVENRLLDRRSNDGFASAIGEPRNAASGKRRDAGDAMYALDDDADQEEELSSRSHLAAD